MVCCGRRFGKTHYGVLTCIIVAARGGRAWWVAPSYNVSSIGWRLLKLILRPLMDAGQLEVRESDRTITFLQSGGVIQVKTGERPDLLRGEGLDHVVFDEVADIRPECWYEAVQPSLVERQGTALFIGTPRGQSNWFFDLFERAGQDDTGEWERWQMPTVANTAIKGLIEFVEKERKHTHPVIFSQEFEAEFVVAGGLIFHEEWEKWYQLVGDQRSYVADSSLVLINSEHIYETCTLSQCLRFATVDLAVSTKTTADFTVIASWALTPKKNLALLDFHQKRMEGPDIVPAMREQRSRWRLAFVGIERVAFQLSIVQGARRQGLPVRELKPDKDKFSRAYNAAAFMEGGRVWYRKTIPSMDKYAIEVRNFPHAPHDDCVDTLAYATDHMDHVTSGPQLVSW